MKPNHSSISPSLNSEEQSLEKMKDLCVDARSKYEQLRTHLNQIDENHPLKLSLKRFEIDILKITDDLYSIQHDLTVLTDGRPAPFDLSHLSLSVVKNEDLPFWGECGDRGFDTIAYLGNYEFEADELLKLRDWIDSVISWHERTS